MILTIVICTVKLDYMKLQVENNFHFDCVLCKLECALVALKDCALVALIILLTGTIYTCLYFNDAQS